MTSPANPLFPGKHFIGTVLGALDAKVEMSGEMTRRYLQRAAMAGIIIGLFYATSYAVVAAFEAVEVGGSTLAPLGRIAGALTFGWALVFIHYSKSELLTSNMMIVSIGGYHRRTSWQRALRLLGLCYLGNAIGGLFVALPFWLSTVTDSAMPLMQHAVDTKLAYVSAGPPGGATSSCGPCSATS